MEEKNEKQKKTVLLFITYITVKTSAELREGREPRLPLFSNMAQNIEIVFLWPIRFRLFVADSFLSIAIDFRGDHPTLGGCLSATPVRYAFMMALSGWPGCTWCFMWSVMSGGAVRVGGIGVGCVVRGARCEIQEQQ